MQTLGPRQEQGCETVPVTSSHEVPPARAPVAAHTVLSATQLLETAQYRTQQFTEERER